jgi:hypothetical protein
VSSPHDIGTSVTRDSAGRSGIEDPSFIDEHLEPVVQTDENSFFAIADEAIVRDEVHADRRLPRLVERSKYIGIETFAGKVRENWSVRKEHQNFCWQKLHTHTFAVKRHTFAGN